LATQTAAITPQPKLIARFPYCLKRIQSYASLGCTSSRRIRRMIYSVSQKQ